MHCSIASERCTWCCTCLCCFRRQWFCKLVAGAHNYLGRSPYAVYTRFTYWRLSGMARRNHKIQPTDLEVAVRLLLRIIEHMPTHILPTVS